MLVSISLPHAKIYSIFANRFLFTHNTFFSLCTAILRFCFTAAKIYYQTYDKRSRAIFASLFFFLSSPGMNWRRQISTQKIRKQAIWLDSRCRINIATLSLFVWLTR
jgi:hypothetical protein